ncbi:hypothetical protein [Salipaludibacillus daqingensis]|nr:hypothetical protein [Salipaludibacillus daqingensis]
MGIRHYKKMEELIDEYLAIENMINEGGDIRQDLYDLKENLDKVMEEKSI